MIRQTITERIRTVGIQPRLAPTNDPASIISVAVADGDNVVWSVMVLSLDHRKARKEKRQHMQRG